MYLLFYYSNEEVHSRDLNDHIAIAGTETMKLAKGFSVPKYLRAGFGLRKFFSSKHKRKGVKKSGSKIM